MLPIPREEKITSMVAVSEFTDDEYLIMLTQGGYIKKTALSAFANIRANGLIAISLNDGDRLRWVRRGRRRIASLSVRVRGWRFISDRITTNCVLWREREESNRCPYAKVTN